MALNSSASYNAIPTASIVGNGARSPTKYEHPEALRLIEEQFLRHNTQMCSLRAIVEGSEMSFETINQKFSQLSKVWKQFNAGRSVLEYNHAAYMQIVGMGRAVLPILLQQLDDGDGDWIIALKYIAGEKVTDPSMRGNFTEIREAWLNWGKTNVFGTGI